MQAVILAAGRGTRMEPLSTLTPKPMLPVGDRPLLARVADVAVDAGADSLVFVVGYRADHVRDYFGRRYRGVPVAYAVQSSVSGTADAVRAAADLLDGRFVVLNGDSLFDPTSVRELFGHEAAVAAHRVPNPEEYGVLTVECGVVTGVVEKPVTPPTNLANAGAYVFPEWVRSALDVPKSERGEHELTDVLARVIEQEAVAAVETDRWLDVARQADLLRANELVLGELRRDVRGAVSPTATVEGEVRIARGATVEPGATVRGPALIAEGATIGADAVVHPLSVVGTNARIGSGCDLRRALLLPGATVSGDVRLRGVVLGPGCDLSPGTAIGGVDGGSAAGAAAVVPSQPVSEGLAYRG